MTITDRLNRMYAELHTIWAENLNMDLVLRDKLADVADCIADLAEAFDTNAKAAHKPTNVAGGRHAVADAINTIDRGNRFFRYAAALTGYVPGKTGVLVEHLPTRENVFVLVERIPKAQQIGQGNIRYTLVVSIDKAMTFWSVDDVLDAVAEVLPLR